MQPYTDGGLVVNETALGATLHIDEAQLEAWIEFRSTPENDLAGFRAAVARASSFGYGPIPLDEDDDIIEFREGGIVRHWLAKTNYRTGGAAA